MGKITADTFNPIKAYCNVRLQQGVPLVDADVNELDDIRKFEVRAFLKWFVGNGVPYGNGGFRVAPAATPVPDDFLILAGSQLPGTSPNATVPSVALNEFALQGVGRCIVDGLDVIISSDISYKTQQLSPVDTSSRYSLPPPVALTATAPGAVPGPMLVYLDIWERPVFFPEDKLVVPPLGIESCARIKRQWVVRTVSGTTVPPTATMPTDNPLETVLHLYYGLAIINRRLVGGSPAPILAGDIVDLREQGLLIPPATLIQDVLGVDPNAYRQGLHRPSMDLRTALNSLLRGEIPGTPETAIASVTGNDYMSYGFGFDGSGGSTAVWGATSPAASLILGAVCRPDPSLKSVVPVQIAAGTILPHAITLPSGDLIVVYNSTTSGSEDVSFIRAAKLTDLPAAAGGAASLPPGAFAPQLVTSKSNPAERHRHPYALVVPSGPGNGGYVLFFWHTTPGASTSPPPPVWMFRRRQYDATWSEATASWVAADGVGAVLASVAVQADVPNPGDFHAAVGANGIVWAAYKTSSAPSTTPSAIQAVQLQVPTGTVSLPQSFLAPAATSNGSPFVVVDGNDHVWIFFSATSTTTSGIYFQQFNSANAKVLVAVSSTPVPGTGTTGSTAAGEPCAALDGSQGIWLVWSSGPIMSMRWNPTTLAWGAARQVTASTQSDRSPFLQFDGSRLWLFWRRVDTSKSPTVTSLLFRQLVPEI